jgi:preprotein translocase subunit SecG
MILNLLLVFQIIICVCLVAVILMQRSEGGALGMGGGGSGGFMTARGAGNLLTRTTAILATLFFLVSGGLTIAGNIQRHNASLANRVEGSAANPSALTTQAQPAAPAAPAPDAAAANPGQPSADSLDSLAAPLTPTSPPPAQPAPATK